MVTSTHIYGGGAVVLYLSNATFLNSKFERNRAEVGGAIQAYSANFKIINSEFVQNHVTTIKRNNIMQCPGPVIDGKQCRGGAITMFHSALVINNTKFYNNTNDFSSGGAINIRESNLTTINSVPYRKLFFVFISWLNLDVGFDIRFVEGLNSYWKTWLELAFPVYIILLVILIMFLSERSVRLSRLIARKNPVAALATLILLSYTKVLRTIIAVLSFARLDYPDGSYKIVWLPDASVYYLNGKHIPLYIVGLLILIIGFLYTSLLFFWQ